MVSQRGVVSLASVPNTPEPALSPFLEPADVERLTGYVMASFQLRFCKNNGIPAWLNARGEVVIPRAAIEGRGPAANEPAWRPDYTALQKG